MADYISREVAIARMTALEVAEPLASMTDAKRVLADMPAADVAPVVHGRWICEWDKSYGTTTVTCSHCKQHRTVRGCHVGTKGESLYDEDEYCPDCGAWMRGRKNNSDMGGI